MNMRLLSSALDAMGKLTPMVVKAKLGCLKKVKTVEVGPS
jgi:hypothetical protein